VAQVFAELGDGDILEVGAGSGKLAAQLLADSDLAGAAPPPQRSRRSAVAARRRSYMILERSADLREVQRQTLERLVPEHLDRVCWLDRPPTEPWQGVLLANEVVDALPIERFLISGDEVRQICVGTDGNRLRLCDRPAPPALEAAVRALGPLPDGYRSEINLQLAPWVESLVAGLERGVALFIDYGYPRREFYLDERSDGTLIANYRHRAHQDVLRYPGLQDLTAFVDFSALASAGKGAGLDQLGYTSQAMFLMGCGLEQVVGKRHGEDVAANMDVNNEVRQLVLPGLMGEKFQVVALGRDWPDSAPLLGFSIRDLRGRL
jgi:SAM-dependent MidA family methyltransferase